jgi:hypothetical protein
LISGSLVGKRSSCFDGSTTDLSGAFQ